MVDAACPFPVSVPPRVTPDKETIVADNCRFADYDSVSVVNKHAPFPIFARDEFLLR